MEYMETNIKAVYAFSFVTRCMIHVIRFINCHNRVKLMFINWTH